MAVSALKNPLDKKEAPRMQPLLFEALAADGNIYLQWSIDYRTNLVAEELDDALISPTLEHISITEKAWALQLLQRHMDISF